MSNNKNTEDLKKKLKGNVLNLQKDRKDNVKHNFLMDQYNNLDTLSEIQEVETSKLVQAPEEWNFYKPLSDSKTLELVDSILNNGLLQPIVVWEQEDQNLMILAGHNRVRVFNILYESTQNEEYLKIPSLIKKQYEITEKQAREIIIDTNWVTRQLSPIEKSKSISVKYAILQNDKSYGEHGKGKVRDRIAEDFKITGRQVESYRNLEKLIPELKVLLEQGKINFTPASKLTSYPSDIQEWIFKNYADKIENKFTKFLKSGMSKDEIKKVFLELDSRNVNVNVSVNVPRKIENRYKKLSKKKKKELERLVLAWFSENV